MNDETWRIQTKRQQRDRETAFEWGLVACVILGIILAALLSGCGKPSPATDTSWRRVSTVELRIALGKAGLRCENGELSPDPVYWAPPREWFVASFPLHFSRWLDATTGAGFRRPVDCDDWSRSAALCAQLTKPGMTVGEYFYHTRTGELHALNVVLVQDDGLGVQVLFWEPQTKKLAALTTNEVVNGCIAWRM